MLESVLLLKIFGSMKLNGKIYIKEEHIINILEDIVILLELGNYYEISKSINDICSFIIQNQQLNVLAVNLGASDYKYSTPIKEYDHTTLLRAHRFPILTTGILWTRHGAAIISKDKNRVRYPYDNYLRMLLTRGHMGLSVKPAIIFPADGYSVIDSTSTGIKRSYKNRSSLYFFKKQIRIIKEKIIAIISKLKWKFYPPQIND